MLGIRISSPAALTGQVIALLTAEDARHCLHLHPDKWSFIVALIAAAAGVLTLTSARVGNLVVQQVARQRISERRARMARRLRKR